MGFSITEIITLEIFKKKDNDDNSRNKIDLSRELLIIVQLSFVDQNNCLVLEVDDNSDDDLRILQ